MFSLNNLYIKTRHVVINNNGAKQQNCSHNQVIPNLLVMANHVNTLKEPEPECKTTLSLDEFVDFSQVKDSIPLNSDPLIL